MKKQPTDFRQNTSYFGDRTLGAAQFAKLELPRSVRELVTLFGSRANSADYEWVQHVAPSKAVGVTDAQRAALESGEIDAAHFNPQELRSTATCAAVQAGPSVPDAIFDFARKHLSDRQLVELVGLHESPCIKHCSTCLDAFEHGTEQAKSH